MVNYITNIVLPDWLLEKQTQDIFIQKVNEYLKKYPEYQLIEVKNGLAKCTRKDEF